MTVKRLKYLPQRHWTPRYLKDRVLESQYRHTHPGEPWLTSTAIGLLSTWLRPSDNALEFGSGRSTAWFAARVGSLVSVEHNPAWHARVTPLVTKLGVDYRLRPDRDGYVGVAREFASSSLDFVLVDGEYRDSCVLAATDLVKPGGLLVVDNANWFIRGPKTGSPWTLAYTSDRWEQFTGQVADWRLMWTTNGVWDTALYFRPCNKCE